MQEKSSVSETDRIFRAIFHRGTVSKILRERFSSASVELESQFERSEVEITRYAVARSCDLEALEFAARLRSRLPLLVHKFKLMIALSECEPRYRIRFVGSRDQRGRAWLAIVWHSGRSAWKLLKGLILLKLLVPVQKGKPHG